MSGLRAASLGSGSKGNSTLVEAGKTSILLDCGFSMRETTRRLEKLGRSPDQINAIVVTHEHGDHVSGVAPLARRYGIPVWLTAGTLRGAPALDTVETGLLRYDEPLVVGDAEIHPFSVPHDAREPAHFVFDDGHSRLAVVTDLGHVTPRVIEALDGCDAIMVESNHDSAMLENGPYPRQLKQRVGGPQGHLNNAQTAALLARLDLTRLRWLCALHLSETNNMPALVRSALSAALDCAQEEILIAGQSSGLDWMPVS